MTLQDKLRDEWALNRRSICMEAAARIDELETALRQASEAEGYSSHEDSCGYRICCSVASYMPHERDCYLMAALKGDSNG